VADASGAIYVTLQKYEEDMDGILQAFGLLKQFQDRSATTLRVLANSFRQCLHAGRGDRRGLRSIQTRLSRMNLRDHEEWVIFGCTMLLCLSIGIGWWFTHKSSTTFTGICGRTRLPASANWPDLRARAARADDLPALVGHPRAEGPAARVSASAAEGLERGLLQQQGQWKGQGRPQ